MLLCFCSLPLRSSIPLQLYRHKNKNLHRMHRFCAEIGSFDLNSEVWCFGSSSVSKCFDARCACRRLTWWCSFFLWFVQRHLLELGVWTDVRALGCTEADGCGMSPMSKRVCCCFRFCSNSWSYLTIGQDDIGCRIWFTGFPRFLEDPP